MPWNFMILYLQLSIKIKISSSFISLLSVKGENFVCECFMSVKYIKTYKYVYIIYKNINIEKRTFI